LANGFCPAEAKRMRREMALEVEGVVNRGVDEQEALGGSK
jgi:hypothetical protein